MGKNYYFFFSIITENILVNSLFATNLKMYIYIFSVKMLHITGIFDYSI